MKKNKTAKKGKKWTCSSCSNVNPNTSPKCSICYSRKPIPSSGKAPQKKRQFKWKVGPENEFKFDFNSVGHPDINNIDWTNATGVQKSKSGSQGVFFVSAPKGALIVKGSSGIAAEVYGAWLGEHFGINTHQCRIIPLFNSVDENGEKLATGEGKDIYLKLVELEKNNAITGLVRSNLMCSYLTIHKYYPGVPLSCEKPEAIEPYLGDSEALTTDGRKRLYDLGFALGFDMLMHNCDRLPLVVKNRGNAGNILFSTAKGEEGKLVFIDNAVTCVDPFKHGKILAEYIDECASFLRHIFATPEVPSRQVKRVADCISQHTLFDIDAMHKFKIEVKEGEKKRYAGGSLDIQRGAIAFVNKIMEEGSLDTFLQYKQKIINVCVNDTGMVGLDYVREDFLYLMLCLFRAKGDLKGMDANTYITSVLSTMGTEGNKTRKCYGSSIKKGGTALVIIDPQVDFHEGGSLEVKGADSDSTRIAELIESDKGMKQISQIIVTLDSHQIFDISHATFWQDTEGKAPNIFTTIELEDVKAGKWKPVRPDFAEHCLEYLESLEKNGKFKLCIWPDHCIIGTPGHCVKPRLLQALNGWVTATLRPINYTFKGSNVRTEMYSCLKAEMVMKDDPGTDLNEKLISDLLLADRVLLCGQALSHCVNFTIRDLISAWPKDQLGKLYLLEDASSPVSGFEKAAADFVKFCSDSGINVIKCTDAF